MSSYGGYGGNEETLAVTSAVKRNPITIARVVNLFLMALFFAAIVLHVVCLAVMAAKHNEIVDKFSGDPFYPNVEKSCILFVHYDTNDGQQSVKWVNNKCSLVIYGSGGLGGCALLMILILLMRILCFRKINFLVILDTIEVVLTGLFAGVVAVIITLGKNETCKSIEKATADSDESESCEDFYLSSLDNDRKVRLYEALRTAQVTSWLAVGVIGVIGMITLIRLLLWLVALHRRRHSYAVDHDDLVGHDQLGGDDQLRNVLSSSYDDVKPLPP